MDYDVVIAGGGPAGLSAALTLGRARKRVLLCDAGPRRNAAAEHMHNFVTRDGVPPDEFRRVAREQLSVYPNVQLAEQGVQGIRGARGAFQVQLAASTPQARRVLLCTGMLDEALPLDGFAALWGHAIFQCPYCHGWEVRDQRWAYLASGLEPMQHFPFLMRSWTRHVTVLTDDKLELPDALRVRLAAAGIAVDARPLVRLAAEGGKLRSIELRHGAAIPCDVLFAHPPQRQVPLVYDLGLALNEHGFVHVDAMTRETSLKGIYAAGDLATGMQGALFAAAAGTQAAAMLNHELSAELAEAEVTAERARAALPRP